MGIDACLLVRIAAKPTDDFRSTVGDALVALFGDGVDDANGLPLREYREAARAWTQPVEENAENWATEIGVSAPSSPGVGTSTRWRVGRGTVYLQDAQHAKGPAGRVVPGGPHLYAATARARWSSIRLICGICDWVGRTSNARVWYGGDSSGVVMEPFPEGKAAGSLDHKKGMEG